MKRNPTRILICILLSFLLISPPAFADDPSQSNISLDEVKAEILTDLIPDYLLSDTQRHITREEFCTIIINLYEKLTNSKVEVPSSNPFTDTDNPDVLKAYSLGIVKGVGNGKFNPDEKLTIQEKAKMLYNTILKIDPSIDDDINHDLDFADEEHISSWAEEAIDFLIYHGILTVDGSNRVNPSAPASTQLVADTIQKVAEHFGDDTGNTSGLANSESSFVYGNVGKDTVILMPDGTMEKVSEIHVGDKILTLNGSQAVIKEKVYGTENAMFKITTQSHEILVGSRSPILTESGFVWACDLITSNIVITSSGKEKVESVEYLAYNDVVYFIILECLPDSEGFVGNGIVIGALNR